MKRKPKKGARADRRARDRDAEKTRERVHKLQRHEPGGSPERAIVLASASQVEIAAVDIACPLCGAALRLEDHQVVSVEGHRLRRATVACRSCRSTFERFFRIGELTN